MSRSGVAVADQCVTTFNDLKLGKKFSYVIFALDAKLTNIVVLKTSEDSDYDNFLENLPDNECRWAVYDFAYELASGEGKRNKIVFYSWTPDNAPIKAKMIYASSRDSIRRALTGVAAEIQGTAYDEVDYQTVLEKVSKGK